MSFDKRTRAALDALRQVQPEEAELRAVCDRFGRRSPGRRFAGMWAGGLCLLGLSLGAVFLFTPSSANAIERMERALASVRTYHMRYYVGQTKAAETWREGSKIRCWAVNTSDWGCDGNLEWRIVLRGLLHEQSSGAPDGYATVTDAFDPRIAQLSNPSAQNKLKLMTANRLKGRPDIKQWRTTVQGADVTAISIDGTWQSGGRFRNVFYCKEKDVPYRVDYYDFRGGVANLNSYELYDYPADISDSTFAFSPPPGMPVLDHVKARHAILDGVAGKTGSATADGVTINILGAFQERDGALYVLWTGGATPHVDCTAAVLDADGKGYDGSIMLEEDDRSRTRNHGKPSPGSSIPKPSRLGIDRPYVIRPLSWVSGKPIYAIRTWTERDLWWKATDLTVRLPICQEGPDRVIRPNPKSLMFQSKGLQVGTGTFRVRTMPVDVLAFLLRPLDPEALNSWGSAPLKMENVDDARRKAIALANGMP